MAFVITISAGECALGGRRQRSGKPRGAGLPRSAPDECVQGWHGGASPLRTFADVEVRVEAGPEINANLNGGVVLEGVWPLADDV